MIKRTSVIDFNVSRYLQLQKQGQHVDKQQTLYLQLYLLLLKCFYGHRLNEMIHFHSSYTGLFTVVHGKAVCPPAVMVSVTEHIIEVVKQVKREQRNTDMLFRRETSQILCQLSVKSETMLLNLNFHPFFVSQGLFHAELMESDLSDQTFHISQGQESCCAQ